MDSHPKKKNNKANQKSNHGHVVGRDQDSLLYTKQKQIKPHYPTLQYRGVYQKKETKYRAKEKQNTEQKRNPKPRANQTHGGAATTRRRSSLNDLRRSSSSRRPSLARRRRSSPAVVARRLPVVADQNGLTISTVPVLGQSALRYFSPIFSLTLSLSLSLSLSH